MADISSLWLRIRAVLCNCIDFTELPPNSNRGQFVERVLGHVGLDPKGAYPWCAALVYWCGYWGLYDPATKKSAWPLKKTAGCQDLADFAKEKGVLSDQPAPGDVFVVWYASMKRFAHTGFLLYQNTDGSWATIEGNTTKPGDNNPETAREGWGCWQKTRKLTAADRVIKWSALL